MHRTRTNVSWRRRLCVALALSLSFVGLTAVPASADMCKRGISEPIDYDLVYPCPGHADQPVGAPVWVTTASGPGFSLNEWDFIKVTKGSRVFFANVGEGDMPMLQGVRVNRMWGDGFESGYVPYGSFAEVGGVPSLPVGTYPFFDVDDRLQGWLYVVD